MFERFLIFALLVSAAVAMPARGHSDIGWTRTETANFEFVGNAPEASIRIVADRLERFRYALGSVLPLPKSTRKTRVIVFRDSASFRSFKPLRPDGTADDSVVGLFVAGEDLNSIAIASDNLEFGTVFHEYVHEVVAANFGSGRIPPWLNEGLATYFQTFQMTGERSATFGTPRPEYLALLNSSPLIPWGEFFALDNFTLHRDSANLRPVFYAQAWALAAYLVNHNGPIQNANSTLVNPSSLKAALEKLDRSKLGESLLSVGSGTAMRVDLVAARPLDRAISVPLSEASANAILGDLLYRQRNPIAESYLRKSIELDEKLAAPYTTLGQLRMRELKFREAKTLLERSIALDSKNYLSHFYYAFLLLRENLDEAAMLQPMKPEVATQIRNAVSRSIGMNGDFAEAHYLLATVEFSSGDTTAAESAIRRAVGLRPGDQNYSLLLARILLRQERVPEAVAIAEPISSVPAEARHRADARAILKDAGELLRAKRSVGEVRELHLTGGRKLEILQYRDLTPERLERIDRDRDIYNYNVMIDRPAADESYVLGYVDRIDCIDERIEFQIKSGSERLTLSTKKFDDVRFRVAIPGTRSFAFRCGTRLPNDLAVIIYKAAGRRSTSRGGELKAMTFVPPDFEYWTTQQMQNAPYYVVEGRPASDLSENDSIAANEREAMEREMRETQIRDIEERLRPPQDGEQRVVGIPEKVECASGRMNLAVKVGDANRVFSTAIAKLFEIQSFNPGAQLLEVGCLAQLPPFPAVITFKTAGNELVSVEFVPAFFKLH